MTLAPQANPANPKPASADFRDLGGRFAKGNPGGPGNPYPRRVAALRLALLSCVTMEDMVAITRALIGEAKDGNVAATKILFQYLFGKPGPVAEMDCGMSDQELSSLMDAIRKATPAAPIANGLNGESGQKEATAAPIANGSNGSVGRIGNPSYLEAGSPPIANGSNGDPDEKKAVAAPIGNGSNGDSDAHKAPTAPKANGSNGKDDEPRTAAAPIANGPNGGCVMSPLGVGAPSGLGLKADQWLDQQMHKIMLALGDKPLISVCNAL